MFPMRNKSGFKSQVPLLSVVFTVVCSEGFYHTGVHTCASVAASLFARQMTSC